MVMGPSNDRGRFLFCSWQEEEWDGRMESKDRKKSQWEEGSESNTAQVEKEGVKGGRNAE